MWKEWALHLYWYFHKYKDEAGDKIIQDMSRLSGVERLVLNPGFEYEEDDEFAIEYLAQDYEIKLADRLGDVILKNITTLIFCVTNPHSVRGILRHMKKLTRLSLYFDTFKPLPAKVLNLNYKEWDKIIGYVGEEVGQSLRYLAIDIRHYDLDPEKHPFAPLGSKKRWPHLEILRFGKAFFAAAPDDRPPHTEKSLKLMQLLKQICDASVKHGGWTINRLVDGLNPYQLSLLGPEETKKLTTWLENCAWNKQHTSTDKARASSDYHLFVAGADLGGRLLEKRQGHEPWTGHIYINDNHFDPIINGEDLDSLPRAIEQVIANWSQAGLPIKFELQIERPYWKENKNNVRENIWKPLIPFLESLHLHPTPCDDFEALQAATDDWKEFMDEFLPECHNLTSLRIQGAGAELSPIFILGKHSNILHNLCMKHKLRHLDIDLGAIMQPGTCLNYANEDPLQLGADIQEPRMVMQHIMWMSIPGSQENPSKHIMLENLTRLTLRNMFVYRQIELTWVCNIPAKLKNLERLEFIGLVWALGFDPEEGKQKKLSFSKDSDEAEEIDEEEDSDGGSANEDDDDNNDNGGGGRSARPSTVIKNATSLTNRAQNGEAEAENTDTREGKIKKKGKSKAKHGEGTDSEDESDEEAGDIPAPPRPEDDEPIKWFEPKDGDYARYNLEEVPDEEVEAERRRKKNKQKAASKKRKRLEKKLAAEQQKSSGEATELGVLEGPSGSRHEGPEYASSETQNIDVAEPTTTTAENTTGIPAEITVAENSQDNGDPPKKKKNKKGKKAAVDPTTDPSLFTLPPEGDPIAAQKTRALVQSIESQFTKFNLGENNELANPTPHHDDGLLAWLPHKDDPTSESSSGEDDEVLSDDEESDAESELSTASTLFGADPRYPEEINIHLRNLRHRDWLVRVLLETAQRTKGKCRDIRITGMKLNGLGQKVWAFDLGFDADIDPYSWSEEEDEGDWELDETDMSEGESEYEGNLMDWESDQDNEDDDDDYYF